MYKYLEKNIIKKSKRTTEEDSVVFFVTNRNTSIRQTQIFQIDEE